MKERVLDTATLPSTQISPGMEWESKCFSILDVCCGAMEMHVQACKYASTAQAWNQNKVAQVEGGKGKKSVHVAAPPYQMDANGQDAETAAVQVQLRYSRLHRHCNISRWRFSKWTTF